MKKLSLCASTAVLALTVGVMASSPAWGQSSSTEPAATAVEEVVVTGSFVRGAAEQTALPVQVLGQQEIANQGTPSTVELIKSIPATAGVFGEANTYGAGRVEGQSNINLRGLGPARTLVLLNGRRLPDSSGSTVAGSYIDVNMISPAAIGRVEVLKDGAAATYGSDAIGGVVNFITRSNVRGLEIGADYSRINGSEGDWTARAIYGAGGEAWDGFVAVSYQHRSQLRSTDRGFATPPFSGQAEAKAAYLYNPQGGWSTAANPGTYIGGKAFNANFLDPGCPAVGGELQISATQCLLRFADYANLVEKQNLYQGYAEFNYDFNADTRLHVEGLYGATEVFHIAQSPSYGPNQFPTTLVSPVPNQYFIPASNPGLRTLLALNPSVAAANPIAATTGVLAHPFFSRPFGAGGNPLYGSAQENRRYAKEYRLAASLRGRSDRFGGVGWDVGATYGHSSYDSINPDFLVDRVELGYRGLASKAGAAPCDIALGSPGVGACYYVNPFSTGVAANAITGQANPQFAAAVALDPRVLNDPQVVQWLYGEDSQRTKTSNNLLVLDFVLDGELPLKLWGGQVAWAAGYQYREATYKTRGLGFSSNDQFPCIDSVINGSTGCAARNGPYSFYGNYPTFDLTQKTHAAFAELQVPVTDDIQMQLAIRHEDSSGGKTTNPKIAVRWQAAPWLAFRGSAGSTFRAAPEVNLSPTQLNTSNIFVPQVGSYRAVEVFGNPDLEPETADTYSVGLIVNAGPFSATLDYWRFDFSDPITIVTGTQILDAIFPAGQPNRCADPAYAGLVSRVTFSGACAPAAILRARTGVMNGSPIKTDGIDLGVDYRLTDGPFGGRVNLGLDGSYTLNYEVSALEMDGVAVAPAYEAAGKLNYRLPSNSLPRLKGSAFAEWGRDGHNLRLTLRYIGPMDDQRAGIFTSPNNGQGATTRGQRIKSFVTADIVYRLDLPSDTTATLGVINVTDEDPPFARLDFSYDPATANPLGRVIKLGVTKRF
ncbi:TonB-dependent receptor domain-containing protein [Phenylobacterium sp.]|uniref:TonB-dependent receptor domain-containing protein n=1 Tax=Phenylobacterium sp. TaxID=1871053 RepID=UPI002FC8E920